MPAIAETAIGFPRVLQNFQRLFYNREVGRPGSTLFELCRDMLYIAVQSAFGIRRVGKQDLELLPVSRQHRLNSVNEYIAPATNHKRESVDLPA
jgi:hypothetical protein